MLSDLFSREFFRDRTMIVLTATLVVSAIVNIMIVLLTLEERNYPVAIRYSDFSASPLDRGSWESLYALPLFSLVVGVFNVAMAVKIHSSRRDIAIGMLSAGLLVLFINGFVSWSLLSLI